MEHNNKGGVDDIKELVANKMKTMLASGEDQPSIFVAQEDWNICVDLMKQSKGSDHLEPLRYHVELVSLLCKCAQGKNRAAEELCQQQLPMDAIIRGLLDDRLTTPLATPEEEMAAHRH